MEVQNDSATTSYAEKQKDILENSPYINWDPMRSCCEHTVDTHAHINHIMVCGTCKHIIKVFAEEKPFRNFLVFCHSKGRKVMACKDSTHYIAIYLSHGNVG